jgi:Glutaredoxin and related proteins
MEVNTKEIMLYSTGCPKCKVLESKLVAKNIKFKEINDREEMVKRDIFQVPVLEIDNKIMGFVEANSWINSYSV